MLKGGFSLKIPSSKVLLAFVILLAVCFVQFAELTHQLRHRAEHSHNYSEQSIDKESKCEVCSYYEYVHAQQLLLDKLDLQWAVRLKMVEFCFFEGIYHTLEAPTALTTNRGPPQNKA